MAGKRNKSGRKTTLTKEIQEKFVIIVEEGNFRDTAAEVLGIPESTAREWFQRGEKEKKGIFHDFFVAVKRAESFAEWRSVQKVKNAADKEWQAAAWWLERKKPGKWGKKALDIGNKDDKPFRIAGDINLFGKAAEMTDEEIEARLEEIARERGGTNPPDRKRETPAEE